MEKVLILEIKKFQKWAEAHGHKDTFNNYMWYKENVFIKTWRTLNKLKLGITPSFLFTFE